ncbi:MAG: c-type cytochrome [Terriglobales bacterium]
MRSSILVIAMLCSGLATSAAQTSVIHQVPIKPTSWASGQRMFQEYCAACHGQNAAGGGPAASACTVQPPDLTRLAAGSGGKFPYDHFYAVMQFGAQLTTPAHGSADMPVWLPLFSSLNGNREGPALQRVHNLARYVASLQAK